MDRNMKHPWFWLGVLLVGGMVILGSRYAPTDRLGYLVLLAGVALVMFPLWERVVTKYLWIVPIVWGVAIVTMAATGHLWAFAALVAIGVVTMVALVLWLPHEESVKIRKAMEAEQPDGRRR